MLPAHECFHTDEMKPANVNLRLVLHEKLGALEPRPDVAFEHKLFERARGPTRRVEMKIITALHLRTIECDARRLQESRGVAAVVRIHADPDTARHEDLLIVEDECLVERLLDGAGDVRGVLRTWNLCEQHRKFITTETRDGIAFANTTRQPLGH